MSNLNRIIFKPRIVMLEMDLFHPDGRAYIISDNAGDDLMKLPFVDNYGNGFNTFPAEVVLRFDHPKNLTPQTLLAMQEEIIEILEKHDRLDEAAKQLELSESPATPTEESNPPT